MLLKNNRGFTLVELMIGVGILGIISLAVMSLTKQSASSQKKFQTDVDADFIAKELSGLLADPANCNASQIIGKNADSTPAGAITDILGKYSTTSISGYGSSQIKVDSYTISNIGFAEITDTTTETALVINFKMPKIVSSTQATIKPRRIKLIITKVGANIATCKSAWVNQQDYWTKNGNDIFYDSGNVGIGTATTPTAKLEVAGNIRATNLWKCTCNNQKDYMFGDDGISGDSPYGSMVYYENITGTDCWVADDVPGSGHYNLQCSQL